MTQKRGGDYLVKVEHVIYGSKAEGMSSFSASVLNIFQNALEMTVANVGMIVRYLKECSTVDIPWLVWEHLQVMDMEGSSTTEIVHSSCASQVLLHPLIWMSESIRGISWFARTQILIKCNFILLHLHFNRGISREQIVADSWPVMTYILVAETDKFFSQKGGN